MKNFDEIFENLPNGWLTKPEAELLVKYASQTKGLMVEVGSFMGRSAVLLANLQRPLICIDTWDDYFHSDLKGEEIFGIFKENTKQYAHVFPLKMKVEDWEPRPVEFICLDGDHTYEGTKAQVEKALACNPKFIAVHDIPSPEVRRAVEEYLGPSELDSTGRMGIWKPK